jgi:hypothetical protein
MTMSDETAKPDADADVETMGIEKIRRELAGYQPGTVVEMVELEAHRERRAQLWARLEALTSSGAKISP